MQYLHQGPSALVRSSLALVALSVMGLGGPLIGGEGAAPAHGAPQGMESIVLGMV